MNEQQPEIVQTNIYKPCVICGNPGVEKHSELLPDRAVLIKVIHDDRKICEFVEYASISSFMERGKKKKDPKMMNCPECGDEGRIGNYRPKKAKQSHKWDYFIVHEQIEGFWGKNTKVKKRRRCYMKTEQQRSQILEKLGRYRL
jgi:hypothetical protein